MSKKNIVLENDKEFIKLLKKASKKFPETTSKVIKNNTEKGKELAASRAPVDTSFLKQNISSGYPNKLTGLIVSGALYSGYVNFGTRFMTAQPYFTDMWDETMDQTKKDLKEVLRGMYD